MLLNALRLSVSRYHLTKVNQFADIMKARHWVFCITAEKLLDVLDDYTTASKFAEKLFTAYDDFKSRASRKRKVHLVSNSVAFTR